MSTPYPTGCTAPAADPQAGQLAKRKGRPRADAGQRAQHRASILQAAALLFREQGYANTNMTAIAKAVGLDQSSIYYWFSSKEQLLDELLMQEFRSCGLRGAIFNAPGAGCAERLYALVYRRTAKYCKLPLDVFEAESVAKRAGGMLEHFFLEFDEYREQLRLLLCEGIESGELRGIPAEDALWLALSAITSMQHQFHRHSSGCSSLAAPSALPEHMGVEDCAHRAAQTVLAALLPDGSSPAAAEQAARSRGWLSNA